MKKTNKQKKKTPAFALAQWCPLKFYFPVHAVGKMLRYNISLLRIWPEHQLIKREWLKIGKKKDHAHHLHSCIYYFISKLNGQLRRSLLSLFLTGYIWSKLNTQFSLLSLYLDFHRITLLLVQIDEHFTFNTCSYLIQRLLFNLKHYYDLVMCLFCSENKYKLLSAIVSFIS